MDSSVRRFGRRAPFSGPAYVLDTRFFIPYKHFTLVWEATKEWHKFSVSKSGLASHRLVSLFNRAVEFGVGITREKNDPEDKGDIVALWYKGYGSLRNGHYRFFQSIAKYVKAGSYINLMKSDRPDRTEMFVSDGKVLEETFKFGQWYFNGDCMVTKTGELTFKSGPGPWHVIEEP